MVSRGLWSLVWTATLSLVLGAATALAQINTLTIPTPNFKPQGPTVTGGQASLRFDLDAAAGRYQVQASSTTGGAGATSVIDKRSGTGTTERFTIGVPLAEGANQFNLTVTAVIGTATRSAGPTTTLTREMKNVPSCVTLDAIVPSTRSTSQTSARLIYTVSGNAARYEVTAVNAFGTTPVTTAIDRGGEGTITVPLASNSPNAFWVTARGIDPPYGPSDSVTSNTLTIVCDTTRPTITSASIIYPGMPTGQTVVSIQGQAEPYATVTVDNTMGDTYSVEADILGTFFVHGVMLPLIPPGPTTTNLLLTARDAAGNVSPTLLLPATRTSAASRFDLLMLTPRSGQQVYGGKPVTLRGAVGDGAQPYNAFFYVRAGSGSAGVDEVFKDLQNGDAFEKDFLLSALPSGPGADVIYSFEAEVFTTSSSTVGRQYVGEITLDNTDPPGPGLGSRFLQRIHTNARLLTVEGTAERFSTVHFIPADGMSFVPGPAAPVESTAAVDGGEFKQTFDMSRLAGVTFSVPAQVIATSGRTGPGSTRDILVDRDTTAPHVAKVLVNGTEDGTNRPVFLKASAIVTLRVVTDEPMSKAPDVWVTERGLDALKAVLTATQPGNQIFDYSYVVTPNPAVINGPDDITDGAVDVVVTGGADLAGNALEPEARFAGLFNKDSMPPVVDLSVARPKPGESVSTPPDPLELTVLEHPYSGYPASGVDIGATTVKAYGPIETSPTTERTGRTEVYSPQTVHFRFSEGQFTREGTYRFEISVADKAGNTDQYTMMLRLDTTPINPRFLVATNPPNGAYVNRQTMPTDTVSRDYVSATFAPDILSELSLAKTTMAVAVQCPARRYLGGVTQTVTPDQVRFVLDERLHPRSTADQANAGLDDGVYSTEIFIRDTAGNTTQGVVTRFTYDTTPPFVLDGDQHSLDTYGITTENRFFPTTNGIACGPLRHVRAGMMDSLSQNGFTGSGINTTATTGSRLVLTLVGAFPTTTLPVGSSTDITPALTSVTRFESIEPKLYSPCFAGVRRADILLELRVDPVTGVPMGLTTGGTMDGIWEMAVTPVDNSGNVGTVVRSRFIHDSIPPFVSVDSITNDQFITSNTVQLTGITYDERKPPTDFGLGVTKVQVRVEQATATGVTTQPPLIDWTSAQLPSNYQLTNASTPLRWTFAGTLPRYVGKGRLIIRAFDRAGNIKDLVRDVNLMTDLLPAPMLRSPPDNSHAASPVVTFTWSQVAGASRYRLTLTDPQGNATVTETKPQFNRAPVSFVDKLEGQYSWIVQAVDTQGVAGHAPYAWRFTHDMTAPRVVSLFPFDPVLPDAHGGPVLDGQVRVGVRFSEPMDTTTTPTVTVKPANPLASELKLTQLHYEEAEWRGLVRIPPSQSGPDVNGVAQVRVTDARDLAGNLVTPYSAQFEILIGPYFEVRAFSSLIDRREILFHFKALHQQGGAPETLTAPPTARVTQQGGTAQILALRKVRNSVWAGPYSVDPSRPGTATLEVNGTDLLGNATTRVIRFDIQTVVGRARAGLSLASGAGRLELPEGAVAGSQTLMVLPAELSPVSADRTDSTTATGQELVPVATLDSLLPVVELLQAGTARIDLSRLSIPAGVDRSKLALYRIADQTAVFQSTVVRKNELVAQLSGTGNLALMVDAKPPSLVRRTGGASDEEPIQLGATRPEVEFDAADGGSGIDPSSVACEVDGKAWSAQFDQASGVARFAAASPVAPGAHDLKVSVSDRAGNTVVRTYKAMGPVPFGVTEFVPWPNPCRTASRLRYRLTAAGLRVAAVIYDMAGHRVTTLEGGTAAGPNDLVWDLTNSGGSPVASGVYVARLKAEGPLGEVLRKDTKIAVIR